MKKLLSNTAKITGFFYLGLALSGMMAFLFARSKLYIESDAMATAANLVTQEGLARFGIAAELALVVFQALTGLYFFKLFQKENFLAAFSLAVFAMVNSIIILIANAFWLNSLMQALSEVDVALVMYSFQLHESIWVVGKLFFGLWLIPMGYLTIKSKMNRVLGNVLVIGGLGYIISVFMGILLPNMSTIAEIITIPATIGEFWMIGYLLFKKLSFK